MKIHIEGDLGYLYDENGTIQHLWVSDDRAKQPLNNFHEDFWAWFAMSTAMGTEHPSPDVASTDTYVGLSTMVRAKAYTLVPNTLFPDVGGNIILLDSSKSMKYLNKKWWQFWK